MAVVKSEFGVASTGEQVYKFKIENSKGEYVSIINYGCTIQAIVVEGKDGKLHDVVLGYDTVKGYEVPCVAERFFGSDLRYRI